MFESLLTEEYKVFFLTGLRNAISGEVQEMEERNLEYFGSRQQTQTMGDKICLNCLHAALEEVECLLEIKD